MSLKALSIIAIVFFTSIPESIAQEQKANLGRDWDAILGPPPAPGSPEEEHDVQILMDYQNIRTDEDCAMAKKYAKMSLKNFFGGPDGPLSKQEVKKNWFFWYKYLAIGGVPSLFAKKHFKRPRPFKAFPQIKPCLDLPRSYSYPSGHTSTSRLMARALALKYPERALLFMQKADEVALSRMIGGVHYPTDVEAGKELADYLADRWLSDKQVLQDLFAE